MEESISTGQGRDSGDRPPEENPPEEHPPIQEESILDQVQQLAAVSSRIGLQSAELIGMEAKISLQAVVHYFAFLTALAMMLVALWLVVSAGAGWWIANYAGSVALGALYFAGANILVSAVLWRNIQSLKQLIGFPKTAAALFSSQSGDKSPGLTGGRDSEEHQ